MRSQRHAFLLSVLSVFILSLSGVFIGCATSSGGGAGSEKFAKRAKDAAVPTPIIDKIETGELLDVNDTAALLNQGIKSGEILKFFRSTFAVYAYKPEQTVPIRQAGASEELIEYMMNSQSLEMKQEMRRQQHFREQFYEDHFPNSPRYN